jgi:hypothetical protein
VVDYLSGPMVVQAVPTHSLILRICTYEPRFIDKNSWITLTHTQIIHSHFNNFYYKVLITSPYSLQSDFATDNPSEVAYFFLPFASPKQSLFTIT